ncbi:MAG: hypothetical protein MJ237_00780 [bacterium]|nr:hypothetical protein [bacterium]
MEILKEILDYIAGTNLFNFVIFLIIIAFVYVRKDVKSVIAKAKSDIDATINASTEAKDNSVISLKNMEQSLSHIEDEVEKILKKSEENATLVGKKILEEAHNSAISIQNGAMKAIENHRNSLRTELIRRASAASVELAKAQIISELQTNETLHDKLIDESVEQLEGVMSV